MLRMGHIRCRRSRTTRRQPGPVERRGRHRVEHRHRKPDRAVERRPQLAAGERAGLVAAHRPGADVGRLGSAGSGEALEPRHERHDGRGDPVGAVRFRAFAARRWPAPGRRRPRCRRDRHSRRHDLQSVDAAVDEPPGDERRAVASGRRDAWRWAGARRQRTDIAGRVGRYARDYDPETNAWASVPQISTAGIHNPEYPFSVLLPDGKIAVVANDQRPVRLLDLGAGTSVDAGSDPGLMSSTLAMSRPGRILSTGGGDPARRPPRRRPPRSSISVSRLPRGGRPRR